MIVARGAWFSEVCSGRERQETHVQSVAWHGQRAAGFYRFRECLLSSLDPSSLTPSTERCLNHALAFYLRSSVHWTKRD
ncbi:hypothetical protein DPX16_22650 [Anabarilius grahami]|uniref:Uncharacterized protein n=1 Tax=Anabarilius grahami TaxID=495550 RepID=A0A3N0XLL9_ANAGA|nr:hypothetical protein DPX16_22650 [Anabarilius grahami]